MTIINTDLLFCVIQPQAHAKLCMGYSCKGITVPVKIIKKRFEQRCRITNDGNKNSLGGHYHFHFLIIEPHVMTKDAYFMLRLAQLIMVEGLSC